MIAPLPTQPDSDNMLLTYFTLLMIGMDMSWLISALGAIFVALSIVKVYMDIRYHPGKKKDDGPKTERSDPEP